MYSIKVKNKLSGYRRRFRLTQMEMGEILEMHHKQISKIECNNHYLKPSHAAQLIEYAKKVHGITLDFNDFYYYILPRETETKEE